MFTDVAAEIGRTSSIQFANIRETAGWSIEADRAGPKMAALLAAAAEPVPPTPSIELESGGVILICGCDEAAIEAGELLKDHLDVTVLIEPPASIAPPRSTTFPVAKGKVTSAKGHFGAFDVMVDDFAEAAPSSRSTLTFGPVAQQHPLDLRHYPRSDRWSRTLCGRRSSRRIFARRSRQSCGDAAGGSQGA